VRRGPGGERRGTAPHDLRARGAALSGHPRVPRDPGGLVVLPELERGTGRAVARRLRPAIEPPDQAAVPRHALGCRDRDRAGVPPRAGLPLFDEPYPGLAAVARQLFYDRLLADFAEHPRTIVLSTPLIDEIADLLEHVVVLAHGRVVLDAPADEVRGTAMTVSGPTIAVEEFVAARPGSHPPSIA